MYDYQNAIVGFLLLSGLFGLSTGCDGEPAVWNSYPGEMGVLSKCEESIYITDCEGLGRAQIRGLIVPIEDGRIYPQATARFPRLPALPQQFTIHWKVVSTGEKFTQEVRFPENSKGSKGRFLFKLDENNVWSCTLMKPDSWKDLMDR